MYRLQKTMLTDSQMIEEIKEFFSCSSCKKLQRTGNILMCSHLICTECLPLSSSPTAHFHCPACKRETLVTPHAFYGLDNDNIKRSCKKFQKNFNEFAEEQDAALGDYLDDKISEIEKKCAEKIKALMTEKEVEIKKLRGEHSKQITEVTSRNSKVREILQGAIENNSGTGSGSGSDSVSDTSPPLSPTLPSPTELPAPLSPSEEHAGSTSSEGVEFPRMINQRRNRQGERKAFKGRRGGCKTEDTCRILTPSPEYLCNDESESGVHFKEGGIYKPKIVFGKRGINPDQFKYPRGVAIDSSGDIFVVDSENPCIRVWSSEGVFKHAFGNIGTAENEFGSPWGISVYQSRVYVTDIEKHSIFVYKTNGKFISSFGKEGNSLNCLREPRGIFASEEGDIYVADSENNRVQVFSESLKHKCFIGEEQLVKPRDVFVDEKGSVHVLDWGHTCIHMFSSQGELVKEFGLMGNENSTVIQPWFFTMDKNGQIIVSDGKAYKQEHNLKVFGKDGQYKFSVGAKGGKPGMFVLPRGVKVNSEGRLIVSDSVNHRLQIF